MASRTITYTDPYGHGNLITKLLYPPTTTRRLVLEGNLHPPSLALRKLSDLVSALSITKPGSTNDERAIIFPGAIIVLVSSAPNLSTLNPYDVSSAKSRPANAVARNVSFASQLEEHKGNICTPCRRFNKPADECIFRDHGDGIVKCNPCRKGGLSRVQCDGLPRRKNSDSDHSSNEEGDDDDAGQDKRLTSDDEEKPKKKKFKRGKKPLGHNAGRVAKKRAANKA